jgi:hypothetical protein
VTELTVVGSTVLGLGALGALFLQGRRPTRARGYAVQSLVCVALVPYNVVTGQYGFTVTAVVSGVLAYRAYRDVRRDDRRTVTGTVPPVGSLTAQRTGPVGPVAGTNDRSTHLEDT